MALMTISFYSHCLGRTVPMRALVPIDASDIAMDSPVKPLPALYLLHGLHGSENDWLTYTRVALWARQKGVAIFCPAGENSFYVNQDAQGKSYLRFLGEELPAFTRRMFPLSHKLNKFIEHEPDDVFPNVMLELDGTIEQLLDTMPAIDVEDYYIQKLKSQRRNVLYNDNVDGVNRTDFKVYYKKKRMPAELCSTGEQKSLLISIILAQTKCQTLDKGFAPVLLLDEVVAHLDDLKREALLEKIRELGIQAWITSTDPKLFASLAEDAQFLTVKNNSVTAS